MDLLETSIVERYLNRIRDLLFPCVAAKAAAANGGIRSYVARHMACPADDRGILDFLYAFVDELRQATHSYMSAIVLFKAPEIQSEEMFDGLLWQRLQSIADLDAQQYSYDGRVDPDPSSSNFSFSIKSEAFYVIGLHPKSSRNARAFPYPGLVFNSHDRFVRLRTEGKFEAMRRTVRKRDARYSGSINPMLTDFGEASEATQYSGRQYDNTWKCPLAKRDGGADNHTTP
jgi:FPC/CPF motif-containing protein YcgG